MSEYEIVANGLWNHRPDARFNCSCGWKGDGFGDPYRAHVSDAVLAALADAGYTVARLEAAGARAPDGSGFRGRNDEWVPEGWETLYRIEESS